MFLLLVKLLLSYLLFELFTYCLLIYLTRKVLENGKIIEKHNFVVGLSCIVYNTQTAKHGLGKCRGQVLDSYYRDAPKLMS